MRLVLILCLSLSLVSSCGYHMRGEHRPFFERNKITRLYVTPVKNNSFKPGVEITIYNALRKRFAQGGYVRIVDDPTQADAEFSVAVSEANYRPQATTTAEKLIGLPQGPNNVQVATSYSALLSIQCSLVQKSAVLWSDTVTRSKTFAASNFMGKLGSTSALLNEGEFERTLNILSANVATDAEESINTLF